jgi:hypothetical protein
VLKLGITRPRDLARRESWLGRSRHASLLLFADLANGAAGGGAAYDCLIERVRLPNGTWKQTAAGRLADVDDLLIDVLHASHPPGTPVSVLDLGASTGVTSLELCDRLRAAHPLRFIASDLYRDAIAVSGRGWAIVCTPRGEDLQYVLGRFVLPAYLEESPLYAVNRALKRYARRRLAPRARAIARAAAGSALPLLESRRIGTHRVMRLPLIASECLRRIRRDDGFAFEVIDVLEPIGARATVVRAMNVVTRDYWDRARARTALTNCLHAVEPGGLLVVGRTDGLARGGTRATCYRVDQRGRVAVAGRLHGGCELEGLVLEIAPATEPDTSIPPMPFTHSEHHGLR